MQFGARVDGVVDAIPEETAAKASACGIGELPALGIEWDLGPEGVCRLVSRLLLGHCFGAIPAPSGDLLFCFDCIAPRVTVSGRALVRRVQRKDFSGASVNAEL